MNEQTKKIREFILNNVSDHPKDISIVTAKRFNITRQAAYRHVAKLVKEGMLFAEGSTRNRKYGLKPLADLTETLPLENLAEDKVWRDYVRPLLIDLPQNILSICEYGFTEMVNNAIDHSEGTKLTISAQRTYQCVEMVVSDNGVGIFNKIQREFGLDDPLHSLLELSKGKLTTDKKRHSGEGIFFTSRMFDMYTIRSGYIVFTHLDHRNRKNEEELGESDFLLEHRKNYKEGTSIIMKIDTSSEKTAQQVFDAYTLDDTFGFTRTFVPVFLSAYGEDNLISRSQAKRLLARFDVFKEIILDFDKVESIGQAFADEVFRVFRQQNPEINIYPIRTNEQVKKMIRHVTGEK